MIIRVINVKQHFLKILKNSKKEITIEFFVCVVLRAILLIIPILYSSMINNVSSSSYEKAIKVLVIYIVLISIYKLFEYIRQHTAYGVYNRLYRDFTSLGMDYTYSSS